MKNNTRQYLTFNKLHKSKLKIVNIYTHIFILHIWCNVESYHNLLKAIDTILTDIISPAIFSWKSDTLSFEERGRIRLIDKLINSR